MLLSTEGDESLVISSEQWDGGAVGPTCLTLQTLAGGPWRYEFCEAKGPSASIQCAPTTPLAFSVAETNGGLLVRYATPRAGFGEVLVTRCSP